MGPMLAGKDRTVGNILFSVKLDTAPLSGEAGLSNVQFGIMVEPSRTFLFLRIVLLFTC